MLCSILLLGAIVDGSARIWLPLFRRCDMLELFERLLNVARHGEMYLSLLVVPIQCDAYVPLSVPFSGDCIVLFQSLFEMKSVLFAHIFYSKVIHY